MWKGVWIAFVLTLMCVYLVLLAHNWMQYSLKRRIGSALIMFGILVAFYIPFAQSWIVHDILVYTISSTNIIGILLNWNK